MAGVQAGVRGQEVETRGKVPEIETYHFPTCEVYTVDRIQVLKVFIPATGKTCGALTDSHFAHHQPKIVCLKWKETGSNLTLVITARHLNWVKDYGQCLRRRDTGAEALIENLGRGI